MLGSISPGRISPGRISDLSLPLAVAGEAHQALERRAIRALARS